jgi:hypothetical protein
MATESLLENAIAAYQQGQLKDFVFGDIALEGTDPDEFVQILDDRLDALVIEGVERALSFEMPESAQFDVVKWAIWGEWRSMGTFALQMSRCDARNPDHEQLRVQLVKQMDDEYRHYRLAETAYKAMGGEGRGLDLDPEVSSATLAASFPYFDEHYTDPLLATGPIQFIDERLPLHFSERVVKKPWATAELIGYLGPTVPDEVFHVQIGRDGVRRVAAQGKARRVALIDQMADSLEKFTFPKIMGQR